MGRQLLAGCLLAAFAAGALAQANYPDRPIRFVVPYPPGGFTDMLARLLGQKLTQSLGQSVIVENRGGGGSTIGTDLVARASPDGYTLLMVAPDFAINESLRGKLPYRAQDDFVPIALAAKSPMVLVVNAASDIQSVEQLIDEAKKHPGRINYASGGNGTGAHLAMELFKTRAGIDMVHVPYKGNGPATTALLAGEASVMFLQVAVAAPHVQAGKLRALALPGAERSKAMPGVRTLSESVLPGFDVTSWFGVVAPAGTPAPIVAKLNAVIDAALEQADVKEALMRQGAEVATGTSEGFAAFIRSEIPRWAEVVKASGARID